MAKYTTVTRDELKKVYDVACTIWKKRLTTFMEGVHPFTQEFDLNPDFIEEMFEAASNTEQSIVLREVFKNYLKQKDKNPFLKDLDILDVVSKMSKLSTDLFAIPSVFQLCRGAAEGIGRSDLRERAFFLSHNYSIKLHPVPEGGTVIEIVKK